MAPNHHVCFIVPPHLLEAMAESQDESIRSLGSKTLAMCEQIHKQRHDHFAAKLQSHHHGGGQRPPGIVPNILLEHLSKAEDVDESVRDSAKKALSVSQKMRDDRQATLASAEQGTPNDEAFVRGVYDMENQGDEEDPSSMDLLPGKPVRLEGQPATEDNSVNEAYENALKVLQFYKEFFSYKSLDGNNMPVISSVHFAKAMGNAFWTSEKQQMVYGDGDGQFLYNFTATLDVIGHEMTHAVTEFNSRLQYQGESGALNEHISDAFGIMVKQKAEGEDAASADWLIGEGCLLPGVKGVALRNMKAPGTAYDDQRFGKDPQPANYADIPAFTAKNKRSVQRDSGGVHIFSGIPNSAFCKCAIAFGGHTWEKAGKIWWKTVTTHRIPPNCKFIQFADATVDVAAELFGDDEAKIVRTAWNDVGVVRKL